MEDNLSKLLLARPSGAGDHPETVRAIDQAGAGQDAKRPGWTTEAYGLALEWIRSRRTSFYFTSEDLRAELYGKIDTPKEPRAWGKVMRMLADASIIEHASYRKSNSKVCHNRPMRVWRVR